MILPELDHGVLISKLEEFIRSRVQEAGHEKVVVGVSGGIDSSLALVLSARALGPANVHAFGLPAHHTSKGALADAEALAGSLLVPYLAIDIRAQLDAYFDLFPVADATRRGNKAARERMSVLYDQAKALSALVCGTSNKSEIMLGYGTVHGDLACSFDPLGDLYKTEINTLARTLDVPESIRTRTPSAELWDGQTDEEELGYTYEELDLLLWAMYDKSMDDEELLEGGFTPEMIDTVRGRVEANAFKRRMPPICFVH